MHRIFGTVVRPLLEATGAEMVVEIGAGSGRLTRRLVEQPGAFVHAIDPAPGFDPQLVAGGDGRLALHEERSLSVLGDLPAVDLAILDGDPNWYTVRHELQLLGAGRNGSGEHAPVILVHNVGWPFARRDGYYDPDVIPEQFRSPSAPLGLLPGHEQPIAEGLSLVPFVGIGERSPHTGVRTAVDDFLAEFPEQWRLVELPGLYGVALLATQPLLAERPGLAEVLDSFERIEFLRSHVDRVERARVAALVLSESSRVKMTAERNGAVEPQMVAGAARQPAEDELADDRLDALQTRLEMLERDRDEQLRETRARLRALEDERAKLVRESTEARVQLGAAHTEIQRLASETRAGARAAADVRELQGELARERQAARSAGMELAGLTQELETARQELDGRHDLENAARAELEQARARFEEQFAALLEERALIGVYVELAANSRAWRLGHRITSFARLVSFRRNRGTSALGKLQQRLAQPPLEQATTRKTNDPEE